MRELPSLREVIALAKSELVLPDPEGSMILDLFLSMLTYSNMFLAESIQSLSQDLMTVLQAR
jgi:hypothetical protein